MMEGYFDRTLGMHRVYNSAFMHMLRDEDNAKYRMAIKNTLEFDPQILKRYVNFMNNPDEKTAIEKYGMEFRKPKWDETPDEGLIAGHNWKIFPILHRRSLFADVEQFFLYDL